MATVLIQRIVAAELTASALGITTTRTASIADGEHGNHHSPIGRITDNK